MDSKLLFVVGNIVEAHEQFICHQTNCVSTHALGLAREIFKVFPYAHTYIHRTTGPRSVPGSIDIKVGIKNIINLNAQVHPGPSKKAGDSSVDRLGYFKTCLASIIKNTPEGSSFAFPYKIGCGLAGGDWSQYKSMLEEFANHPSVKSVVIYSLE